jgi:hypothetical protein
MTQPSDLRGRVAAELASIQEDVLYTEKAHFAAAEARGRVHLLLGLTAAVSAAVSAATIVADGSATAAGMAALISAIASGVLTFLRPEEAAQKHLDAGRDLGALRVRLRQAVSLDLAHEGVPPEDARRRAAVLAQEKADIDRSAPALSGLAFRHAQKKIDRGDFRHAHEGS